MRLLLIRHGQTPPNIAGALDTGFPGAGLTSLGQTQADALADALADEQIAGIYASRLVRTQLTAAPLARACGTDVRVRSGLEEVTAGDLELRTDREAVRAYADCLRSWMRGELWCSLPGGTTGLEFVGRYDAALRTIAAEHGGDETVVVVSHGAAIRVYAAFAARLPAEVAVELQIQNTGMGLLEGHPTTGWQLTRWISEPLGGSRLEDRQAHDVTGVTSGTSRGRECPAP